MTSPLVALAIPLIYGAVMEAFLLLRRHIDRKDREKS